MPSSIAVAQIISISTALVASGGIASLTLFDVPELQAQPASRALPSIRWLFSRGSHIFPPAAAISSAGFAYLAYNALPKSVGSQSMIQLLRQGRVPGYIAAAILTISIAPFTSLMIPTNFRLIELNESKGGSRSERSAETRKTGAGERSVDDSVNGEGDVSQYKDLSKPQRQTPQSTSDAEDKEVEELLSKFGKLNSVRALLMAAGGIVGLATALA